MRRWEAANRPLCIFRPAITQEETQQQLVDDLVQKAFGGAVSHVAAACGNRFSYAQALANLEEQCGKLPNLAVAVTGGRSDLRGRIEDVLARIIHLDQTTFRKCFSEMVFLPHHPKALCSELVLEIPMCRAIGE